MLHGRFGLPLLFAAVIATGGDSFASESYERAGPRITVPWLALQLVPSPEVMAQPGGAHFGARWQITPVLYSFGIHRDLSPFRAFIVEPIVRHSGSTEIYVSPEYLSVGSDFGRRFGVRLGLRSTFPVVQRGDYLSVSLGTSMLQFQGEQTMGYEAGAHVLFGFLGTIVTFSPTPSGNRWIFTFDARFF